MQAWMLRRQSFESLRSAGVRALGAARMDELPALFPGDTDVKTAQRIMEESGGGGGISR